MTTVTIGDLAAGTAALDALLEIESAGGVSGQVVASALLELGNHWGEPIATWTYSSGVAVVDFTGLAAYRELLVIGEGIQHGDASTQNVVLRTSTDNGSSFATTSYTNYGAATTSGLLMVGPVASAISCGFRAQIIDFNVAARSSRFSAFGGQAGSSTNRASYFGARDTAETNNALRMTLSGGVNFTAGNLLLFGRKG